MIAPGFHPQNRRLPAPPADRVDRRQGSVRCLTMHLSQSTCHSHSQYPITSRQHTGSGVKPRPYTVGPRREPALCPSGADGGLMAWLVQESAGWTNQFAPECSVAGEAPGAVCEALAAHHRNARGRFQTFWSPRCPLLLPGLTALQRAAYTSDCLQPFASGAPLLSSFGSSVSIVSVVILENRYINLVFIQSDRA